MRVLPKMDYRKKGGKKSKKTVDNGSGMWYPIRVAADGGGSVNLDKRTAMQP